MSAAFSMAVGPERPSEHASRRESRRVVVVHLEQASDPRLREVAAFAPAMASTVWKDSRCGSPTTSRSGPRAGRCGRAGDLSRRDHAHFDHRDLRTRPQIVERQRQADEVVEVARVSDVWSRPLGTPRSLLRRRLSRAAGYRHDARARSPADTAGSVLERPSRVFHFDHDRRRPRRQLPRPRRPRDGRPRPPRTPIATATQSCPSKRSPWMREKQIAGLPTTRESMRKAAGASAIFSTRVPPRRWSRRPSRCGAPFQRDGRVIFLPQCRAPAGLRKRLACGFPVVEVNRSVPNPVVVFVPFSSNDDHVPFPMRSR